MCSDLMMRMDPNLNYGWQNTDALKGQADIFNPSILRKKYLLSSGFLYYMDQQALTYVGIHGYTVTVLYICDMTWL